MRRYDRGVLLFALIWFLAVGPVHAGGLWLTLQPTPDMGVGSAGSQAAGFDASTATANPAAMTRLDRSQMEAGIMGLYVDSQFNVKNSSNGDNGGGNAGYFSPVPTLNYVHSVSPDLKLGLGVGSYFGLGLNYSNEWAGKYYVQNASITTLAVNPTIGYKIADWLSVGGGVSVVQGNLSERVAVNTLLEPGDGRLKYDASDVGYGYNLGVLFELSPQTRVGVTYVSQVNLDFKDEMRFKNLDGTILGAALNASGLLDAQLKINMNIPAQLSVGAYHALTDKLALVGTVNWQNWSRFGEPEIAVADSNTVTADLDYQDTYHAGHRGLLPRGGALAADGRFRLRHLAHLQQQRALARAALGRDLHLFGRRSVRLEQGFLGGRGLRPDRRRHRQGQQIRRAAQGGPRRRVRHQLHPRVQRELRLPVLTGRRRRRRRLEDPGISRTMICSCPPNRAEILKGGKSG